MATGDGTEFVKVLPYNRSLVNMVCKHNDRAPVPVPPRFSLTAVSGLERIKTARNTAQARELDGNTAKCSLFELEGDEDDANTRPTKKRANTRATQRDLRACPKAIDIVVDGRQMQVMRPVVPTDAIYIKYDKDMLEHLVTILRESDDWDDGGVATRARNPARPKHVWARKDCYIAVVPSPEGSAKKRYRSVKTLDDAKAALAEADFE